MTAYLSFVTISILFTKRKQVFKNHTLCLKFRRIHRCYLFTKCIGLECIIYLVVISSEGVCTQLQWTTQRSSTCLAYSPVSRVLKQAVLTARNLASPISYHPSLQLLLILQAPAEISLPPRKFPACLINEDRPHTQCNDHRLYLDCLFICRSPCPKLSMICIYYQSFGGAWPDHCRQ